MQNVRQLRKVSNLYISQFLCVKSVLLENLFTIYVAEADSHEFVQLLINKYYSW